MEKRGSDRDKSNNFREKMNNKSRFFCWFFYFSCIRNLLIRKQFTYFFELQQPLRSTTPVALSCYYQDYNAQNNSDIIIISYFNLNIFPSQVNALWNNISIQNPFD